MTLPHCKVLLLASSGGNLVSQHSAGANGPIAVKLQKKNTSSKAEHVTSVVIKQPDQRETAGSVDRNVDGSGNKAQPFSKVASARTSLILPSGAMVNLEVP